jgi:subfamily B ATP-binding cassette protein MsbA
MLNPQYRTFLAYLFNHKWKAVSITIMAFIQAAINLLSIAMIPQIIFILDPSYKLSTKGFDSSYNFMGMLLKYIIDFLQKYDFFERIVVAISIFAGLLIFKNIVAYIRRITTSWLNLSVINDIRQDVYYKIQKLPISDFRDKETGHLLTLITVDVRKIMTSLRQVFDQMVTEPINILLALYTIIAFSSKLSLVLVVVAPVIFFAITKVGVILKRRSERTIKQNDRFMTTLTESFAGIKEIKAFNAEEFQYKKYLKEQNKLKRLRFRQSLMQLLNMPLTEALGAILVGLIIIFGAYLIQTDESFTAVQFSAILAIIISILEPMKKLGHIYNEFKVAMVSANRLFNVVDSDTNEHDIGDSEIENFNDTIEFRNVDFKYVDDAEFELSDVSFTIKKGENVAIVGSSGSGKSTIADLIGRFYLIDSGDIKIDGKSINELRLKSIRKLITYVLQDNFLFNDTVANNIRFNQIDATESDIKNAAKIANAAEFIEALDEGYETVVGEKGSKLSGGQKQRIAIARAVLRNSPIMVFDEATSALDSESEKSVQDALDNVMKSHTSIVIAHRLSTIINSDKIIVMEKGEVVEIGTHQDLIQRDGYYKRLYDIQFTS